VAELEVSQGCPRRRHHLRRWTLTQKGPRSARAKLDCGLEGGTSTPPTAPCAPRARSEPGSGVRAGARDRERQRSPQPLHRRGSGARRRRAGGRPAPTAAPEDGAQSPPRLPQPSNRNAPPAPPGAAAGDPTGGLHLGSGARRRGRASQVSAPEPRPAWRPRPRPSLTRRLEQSHPAPAPDLKN